MCAYMYLYSYENACAPVLRGARQTRSDDFCCEREDGLVNPRWPGVKGYARV